MRAQGLVHQLTHVLRRVDALAYHYGVRVTAKDAALQDLDRHDVRAGQRWRHFKGGVYTVVAVGIDEPTLNPVVIYAGHDGIVWVRTLSEWIRLAKPGVPRFQRMDDEHHAPRGCLMSEGSCKAADCETHGPLFPPRPRHPHQGTPRGGRFL